MRRMKKTSEVYKVFLQYKPYSKFDGSHHMEHVRTEEFRVNTEEDALKFAKCAENFQNVVNVSAVKSITCECENLDCFYSSK